MLIVLIGTGVVGLILPVVASGGNTVAAGLFEAVLACLADGWAAAVVLVVGGDVADAFVEAHGVVVLAEVAEVAATNSRNLCSLQSWQGR